MLLLSSACSDADILLGWARNTGTSAGTGAPDPDAGSGMVASAGQTGGGGTMLGVAGKSAQAGTGGVSAPAGTAANGGATAMTTAMAGAGGAGTPSWGSPGCNEEPPAADIGSIQISGMSASYLVDLPPGYDKTRPYPMVMAFRGDNVTTEQFRGDLDLPRVAGAEAILVHPNSLGGAFSWDVQRDVPLFDSVLTQVSERYCVDERRIFAAGNGIGGYFASALGCLRANKLRGIAAVSPGIPPNSACQGEVAVWIAQSADTPIGTSNGRDTSNFWAKRSGCDSTMSSAVEPSPCREFADCRAGFAVRYCEYSGSSDLPPFAAAGLWGFFKGL